MADPLTVECPDCAVPAGQPCATHLPPTFDDASQPTATYHAERQRVADLRALEHGTCALCGQRMVRGSVEGAPVDAWHPITYDADRCPQLPDPRTNYNAWAEAQNAGLTAGHPGAEHFIPDAVDPPRPQECADCGPISPEHAAAHDTFHATGGAICPECAQGKHPNCVGQALDPATDTFVPCACEEASHAL